MAPHSLEGVMTRGGRRDGAGRKSDADTPRSVRFELKLTPAQAWWLDHLATSTKQSRSSVISAALDRTIGEHTCNECHVSGKTLGLAESKAQADPVSETTETPP